MGRTYAGVLGSLAMLTCLTRGAIHASSTEAILLGAWLAMIAFAAVGYLVGQIAEHTVGESVRAMLQAEVAENRATAEAELSPQKTELSP